MTTTQLPSIQTLPSGATGVLRRARPEESPAVARLVALDSARALVGDVVIAYVGGRPVAAASVVEDRVVADPFEPTAEVVEALRDHLAARRHARGAAARAASRSRARPRSVWASS